MRITSWIAKVRIRRLVQNGMVIRKSQISRLPGGRVAMNQAVGKPSSAQITVVCSARLIERQKIEACAWLSETASGSKMSRVKNTRNQPSVENCQRTPPKSPGVRKE